MSDNSQQPNDLAAGQRRLATDRRRFPTPWLSRFTLRGQRRRIRRDEDLLRGRYVDRADGPYLKGILILVVLVALDTLSTLFIISRGGTEANPLMRSLLERGTPWFLLVKLAPLPIAFVLLSVARHFGWVRWMMVLLLVVYGLLAGLHLRLLVTILFN